MVEAFDEYAAVTKIKESCSIVTKIAEVQDRAKKHSGIIKGKIDEKALSVVCSQFAIILGAGLPIVRTVELIANQTTDKPLKRILESVAGDISEGFGLAQSFESKGPGLPTTFIETVRSGEESGTLDTAFQRLQAYYDKSSKMKAKVKTAMVYPAFTISVSIVVVILLMVTAVPTFTRIYSGMDMILPLPTRILIGVSNFMHHYWYILLSAIALLILGYKLHGRTERGRLGQGQMKLKLPVLGKINISKAASQYANTLSTLLSAGLPLMRAVETTSKVLDNYFIGHHLSLLLPKLEGGKTLGNSLRNVPFLPDLVVEMTGVGEETGTLENTLDVIGSYYDNEAQVTSERALSLLEPIIIVLLAVVVGGILLAVYMPMFGMYGSL